MDAAALEWTLADRVRKVRKAAGLSQAEFAALIGESPGNVANWEAGNSRPRHLVELAKLMEERMEVPGLGAWLLGLTEAVPVTARYSQPPSLTSPSRRHLLTLGKVA